MEFCQRRIILGKQFFRFIISGGTAAFFGLLTLYLLTNIFHVWYLVSSTTAFLVGFVLAFSLQKFWSFQNKHWHLVPRQATISIVLAGLNFFINVGLMCILVDKLHLHYFFSQFLVYGFFAVFDFFIFKFVIFKT